jgi:hypothetical protein
MTASSSWGSPDVCRHWLPTWRPQYCRPGPPSALLVPRDPGPGGQHAPFTAWQDEIALGAGPLRPIPVGRQVALSALRALLALGTLAKTHQHTVARTGPGSRCHTSRPPLPAHNPQTPGDPSAIADERAAAPSSQVQSLGGNERESGGAGCGWSVMVSPTSRTVQKT